MASTEPRSFERGDPVSDSALQSAMDASTEPRSFERGDHVLRGPSSAVARLQRSRALSSAEIRAAGDASPVLVQASTEPRSFERGDERAASASPAARLASTEPRSFERGDSERTHRMGDGCGLQRSRALSSAEIRQEALSDLASQLLQRSRALSSAEIRGSRRRRRQTRALQRSRALSSAEMATQPLPTTSMALASTEPRSFERGDTMSCDRCDTFGGASTEPRSFERGDGGAQR